MKIKSIMLVIVALCIFSLSAIAQGTNAIPSAGAVTVAPPANVSPLLALVTLGVPLAVAFIKTKLWPKVPTPLLPIIAVVLGIVVTFILNSAGAVTTNPLWGSVLGAAGIGLREIKDQLFPADTSGQKINGV